MSPGQMADVFVFFSICAIAFFIRLPRLCRTSFNNFNNFCLSMNVILTKAADPLTENEPSALSLSLSLSDAHWCCYALLKAYLAWCTMAGHHIFHSTMCDTIQCQILLWRSSLGTLWGNFATLRDLTVKSREKKSQEYIHT